MEYTIIVCTALAAVVLAQETAERAGIPSTCMCKRDGYQLVVHASPSRLEQVFFSN